MGARVLVTGRLRPELGTSALVEGVRYADIRSSAAVLAALADAGGAENPVIVLCPATDGRAAMREVALASVALDGFPVVVPLPCPPLGVAVLAALVDEAGRHTEPGGQLVFLEWLRTVLWAAVWVPSIAKIERPAPSLGQHLGSWLPGNGFLLEYGRTQRVHPARQPPLPELDVPPGLTLVHNTGQAPDWVLPAVVAGTRPASQMKVEGWCAPKDAYGTSVAAEFVAMPANPIAVIAELNRSRTFCVCDGCGLRHAVVTCPFCGMAVNRNVPPGGGAE